MGRAILSKVTTPVDGLTWEYGSLGIDKGKGSQIATYGDQGDLTGEQLRLHAPKHLYFNEIAVTYAYEGFCWIDRRMPHA